MRHLTAIGALVFWIAACGGTPPAPLADTAPRPPEPGVSWESGDAGIDALIRHLGPTLAANRKQFTGVTGRVRGYGAGDRYPQVWIRDSATLVPLARYFAPADVLHSWLEEHLAHQEPSGALYDWVAPGRPEDFPWAPRARTLLDEPPLVLSADKNTTEADQESSAVLAAERVFAVTGDAGWLRTGVAGRPLLERLDAALEFVARERSDPRGLVTSALTADWGDVSPTYADQRAIYLDAQTPRVAPLYANALYVGASRALARLHQAVADAEGAALWEQRASDVNAAMRRHLWQPKRGRFRIHAELAGTPPHPDEEEMLAFGGHAVAALHGLLTVEELGRLLAETEAAHADHGVSTLAGTLLPPYPAGFFQHAALKEPWTYQNGGQWDWFAGRFVLALFERGQAEAARRHLSKIAARVDRSGGCYEWYTPAGEGRGSPRYAGCAAALGRAAIDGLFGVELGADGLNLSPRLGGHSGSIDLEEPATGRRVGYEYLADLPGNALRLTLLPETRPRPRAVEVLLPEGRAVEACRVDGAAANFDVRDLGGDRYVVLSPREPWRELEVRLTTAPAPRPPLPPR